MASSTQWTWVWANSGGWWGTGKPGVLQSMGSQSWTRLSNWTTVLQVYHYLVSVLTLDFLWQMNMRLSMVPIMPTLSLSLFSTCLSQGHPCDIRLWVFGGKRWRGADWIKSDLVQWKSSIFKDGRHLYTLTIDCENWEKII